MRGCFSRVSVSVKGQRLYLFLTITIAGDELYAFNPTLTDPVGAVRLET